MFGKTLILLLVISGIIFAASSDTSASPVDQCCGTIIMILGTVGISAYASLKK